MIKPTSNLKPGDVILALDGHTLPRPVKVTKFIENDPDGTAIVEVEQDPRSVISPRRYLRHDQAEVGRKVTLAGVKLIKVDDERYRTPDGRYEVYRDDFPTDCEDAHPVKMTRKLAQKINASPQMWCVEARYAAENYGQSWYDEKSGKRHVVKGYMCPGGEEHAYHQWTAYDTTDSSVEIGHWRDTATDAADDLRRHLEGLR